MVYRRLYQPRILFQIRNYCERKENITIRRSGDSGTSKTLAGDVQPKDSPIFNAIGAAEELVSSIGLAKEHAMEADHEYRDKLKRIQTTVIDITSAISRSNKNGSSNVVPDVYTQELEDWIREYSKQLPPEPEDHEYIIPGGGVTSASLHVARAVCRRAERSVVPLVREGGLHKEAQVYLNRLGDFLLCVSRMAAKLDKRTESIYIPSQKTQNIQAQ